MSGSTEPVVAARVVAERVVTARAGLVGNPSDGYGGAVVAVPVPGLTATVTVTPSPGGAGVTITGPAGAATWPSVEALAGEVRRSGHPVAQRIVTAALVTCAVHLRERGVAVPDLRLAWSTRIPRSVGLAGSSAIAVGVIDAVADAAGHHLDPLVVAALALDAEVTELGIAAGWQDRVVQAVGRPVLVDATEMHERDGTPVPTVRELRPATPLRLLVGWDPSSASDSGRYHGSVRRRADEIAGAMGELAELARRAADALGTGAVGTFADAVDRTWRIRRRVVPLRPDHAALVDAVRATGVVATTPGSGGSVVAILPDDADDADAVGDVSDVHIVTEALDARGASWYAWGVRRGGTTWGHDVAGATGGCHPGCTADQQ